MITSAQLSYIINRFSNQHYDKTKQDITIQIKQVCKATSDFEDLVISISNRTIDNHDEGIKRGLLAGILIGILLEKEYKV